MKLTFALLEKYRDIIKFDIEPEECACPSISHCKDCPFEQGGCQLDLESPKYSALLKAFRQKYPELFI